MALTKIGSIGINTGIQFAGVTTTATLKVGTGVTISSDGDGFFTGVVTATSYAGDGSALTGIAATDNVRTGILDVAGVTTHRDDVLFTGASYNAVWNKSDNELEFADNAKVTFGAGPDLSIYHNATDSYIQNTTGVLRINNDGTDLVISTDDNIHIRTNGTEEGVKVIKDGTVELYYDNTKKLETKSDGLLVSGSVTLTGQNTVHTAGGLAFGYEGSHIHQIRTYGGNASNGGQLNLVTSRSDGTSSYTITLINNSGHLNVPDDQQLQCGNGADLKLYHESSSTTNWIEAPNGDMKLQCTDGDIYLNPKAGETGVKVITDGAVELYENDTKRFETNSTGTKTTGGHIMTNGGTLTGGDLSFADDSKAKFGDGNDLQIYHNGSDSFIKNATGGLNLTTADGAPLYIRGGDNMGETLAEFHDNGAVKLFYDNANTLETTQYGVTISNGDTDTTPAGAHLKIVHTGSPADDQVLLTLQNGDGTSGTDISGGNASHIDFVFRDDNENVTPQARITGHAGDGGEPNTTNKEGKGYLTFHCSNTGNNSGDENPGERLKIAHDGTFTGSGSNDISDQRLKENIATITNATDKIKALTGRTFTWKSEADMPAGTHYGFIAQEIEPIIPDVVINHTGIRAFDKDDNLMSDANEPPEGGSYAKSVHTTGVVPVLVEALKEALTEIDNLKARVTTLESA